MACLCHIKQNNLTYLGRVRTPYEWSRNLVCVNSCEAPGRFLSGLVFKRRHASEAQTGVTISWSNSFPYLNVLKFNGWGLNHKWFAVQILHIEICFVIDLIFAQEILILKKICFELYHINFAVRPRWLSN